MRRRGGSESDFFETVGTAAGHGGMGQPTQSPGGMTFPPGHGEARFNGPASAWAQADNAFFGITSAHETLPAGTYRCDMNPVHGPMLLKQKIDTDGLLRLSDSVVDSVLEEIRRFRGMKGRFGALSLLHKRGVLLWGPPGSGKTAAVHLTSAMIVGEEGGLAILVDHPRAAADCLQLVRRIEPDRPILAILEDLDALTSRFGENEFLALLDGEAQVDNIVFIATTNYPERLDRRFVDRPSRFDTVRFVGMPTAEARRQFLVGKSPALAIEGAEAYVAATDGMSLAHLRELIVLTQCYEYSLEESVLRLRAMMKAKPDSDRRPGLLGAGFLAGG